jgi:hypothetical protein
MCSARSCNRMQRLVWCFLGVACFCTSGARAYHPRRRSAAPRAHAACVPPPADRMITGGECVRSWAARWHGIPLWSNSGPRTSPVFGYFRPTQGYRVLPKLSKLDKVSNVRAGRRLRLNSTTQDTKTAMRTTAAVSLCHWSLPATSNQRPVSHFNYDPNQQPAGRLHQPRGGAEARRLSMACY